MRTTSTADGAQAEGSTDADTAKPGQTHSSVKGNVAPRLPHERDESSDSGQGAPSDVMKRAADDAESDKRPTDKGEATDDVYRRTLRDDTPGQERDTP